MVCLKFLRRFSLSSSCTLSKKFANFEIVCSLIPNILLNLKLPVSASFIISQSHIASLVAFATSSKRSLDIFKASSATKRFFDTAWRSEISRTGPIVTSSPLNFVREPNTSA